WMFQSRAYSLEAHVSFAPTIRTFPLTAPPFLTHAWILLVSPPWARITTTSKANRDMSASRSAPSLSPAPENRDVGVTIGRSSYATSRRISEGRLGRSE